MDCHTQELRSSGVTSDLGKRPEPRRLGQHGDFHCFLRSPPGKCRDSKINLATTASFDLLSNALSLIRSFNAIYQSFFLFAYRGVESILGPLGTSATDWPTVPAPGGCGDDGEFGGMKIGKGNRSTLRKTAPAPLCPPQIPLARPGFEPGHGAAYIWSY
jgi:hypothetical protein